MVRNYTDKELLDRVKALDSFKGYPMGRWILGVRSSADLPNKFDDKFYIYEGTRFITVMSGTTNPGLSILKGGFERFNKLGGAIVKADECYYNLWLYGLHRGRMPALKQLGAPIIVYRDGNKNNKAEELGDPIKGWYGINFHTNTYDFSAKNLKIKKSDINNWSAGCMVPNDRIKYVEQMKYFKEALKTGAQKYVTFVLINEF